MGKQIVAVQGRGGLPHRGADPAGCTATAADSAGPSSTSSTDGPANAGPASHPASTATTARLASTDTATTRRQRPPTVVKNVVSKGFICAS